jgi:hypothetical protein
MKLRLWPHTDRYVIHLCNEQSETITAALSVPVMSPKHSGRKQTAKELHRISSATAAPVEAHFDGNDAQHTAKED